MTKERKEKKQKNWKSGEAYFQIHYLMSSKSQVFNSKNKNHSPSEEEKKTYTEKKMYDLFKEMGEGRNCTKNN